MTHKIQSLILKLSIMAILVLAVIFGTSCSSVRSAAFCPNKKADHTAFYNKHYSF